MQLTGKLDRHIKETAQRARKRAAEFWSKGERKFKNNFPIRMQMFSALVTPIMSYATEIMG